MTKVALIAVNDMSDKVIQESVGLARIDAYLKQNEMSSEVLYLEMKQDTNIDELASMISEDFQLIGFSLFSSNVHIIYKLSEVLKKRNKESIIFIGGYLATTAYEFIFEECLYIDFAVLGYGELTMLDIVRSFNKGLRDFSFLKHVKTRNDTFEKTPGKVNINEMPFPTRIYNYAGKQYRSLSARICASHGCTNNCSFCAMTKLNRKWEGRCVDSIYQEIMNCYQNYGIRSFIFNDDSFEDPGELGKLKLKELCEKILSASVRFQFQCNFKAKSFNENDAKLVELLKKAGFSQVFIGFEANNETDLKIYNKNTSVEDNHRAYNLFNNAGINVRIGYIMVNPYSTLETIRENYKFLVDLKIFDIHQYTSKLNAYYNTKIYKDLLQDNLLRPDYNYINSSAYYYVDENTKVLMEFIEKNIYDTPIYKAYFELSYFLFLRDILKPLFPNEIERYEDRFIKTKNKMADTIKLFFDILYIEFDIDKAYQAIPGFINQMMDLYKEFSKLKLAIMKNATVRKFMVESMLPVNETKT